MKIEVRRKDDSVELVEDSFLQFMIDMEQIVAFKRSSGWVTIGVDQIRRGGFGFAGRELRRPAFGPVRP